MTRAPRRCRPPLRALPVPLRRCCGAASRCCARSATPIPDDAAGVAGRPTSCSSAPTCSRRRSPARGRRRRVYLPAGLWVDLYTGATVKGPARLHAPDAARRVPALRARGRGRPVQPPHAADSWWGVDELTHPGRAGFLVSERRRARPHGQPHDVQLFVPAARRPAPRHARRAAGALELERRAAPRRRVRVHGPAVRGADRPLAVA